MENKFKKGLILGGLLAAVAALGLTMNNGVKKLTEELQIDIKDLAKHLKKDLNELQDVTKENFDSLVTAAVNKYAEKKELTNEIKETLVVALQTVWQEIAEDNFSEKDQDETK